MAASLLIRDGDTYWWNSPDIWVIPGSDPNGSPGQPIAGQSAFVWVRVQNTGDVAVMGARINFYWANPTTGVYRSTANYIGSSFVDLSAGETKEVLCVTPWIPVIVNDGHECLVAEVIHTADPLPTPLPDEFNAKIYRQIAQKNLSVLNASMRTMSLTIQLTGDKRREKTVKLSIETGGNIGKQHLMQLGLQQYKEFKTDFVNATLTVENTCAEEMDKPKRELKMIIRKGETKAVYLKISPMKLKKNTYLPISVVSRDEKGRVDGGITYLLINIKDF